MESLFSEYNYIFDKQQELINFSNNHYFPNNDSEIFKDINDDEYEMKFKENNDYEKKSTSGSNIEEPKDNEGLPITQEYIFQDFTPNKEIYIEKNPFKSFTENNIQLKEEEEEEIKEEIVSYQLKDYTLDKNKTQTNESNNNSDSTTILNKKRGITKYNDDNLRRKCKQILFDTLLEFINNKISEVYNHKIGQGICKKQLKGLNKKNKSEVEIKFNQDLLYKTIGEIFSREITGRISTLPPDNNKKIIQNLIQETDLYKRNIFIDLFNLTFIQCLGHFRGSEYHKELEGMINLNEKLKSYSNEEEYVNSLKYYFQYYEKILNNKKSRKKKINEKDTLNSN